MINAVGRDIPEELLVNGKEVYQGKNYMDGKYLHKAAVGNSAYVRGQANIQSTFSQCLFEGRQAGFCNLNDDSRILFPE